MKQDTTKALLELVTHQSVVLNRLDYARKSGQMFGGKRDMYKVLGYKEQLKFTDFLNKYQRQDIAKRIINAYPDSIWTNPPVLRQNDTDEKDTPLETAFHELARKTKLFHYLNRLDKLAGIGQYAVLLIGVGDGKGLEAPLGMKSGKIAYLMPFSEENAIIDKYDEDTSSPRYGLPERYKLRTGGYQGEQSSQMKSGERLVHHSRILHIAEDVLENNVFGSSRLEAVMNRLDDLEKVVGGGSEIFWINGRGGLNLNAEKDAEIVDKEELAKHAEEYVHQLTRILKTRGMDVKTLQLEVHDPDKHVDVLLDLIASATGVPKRILIGSERGELASSQDESTWWSRVAERRRNYCEPMVLRPFIDRLMAHGMLPQEEYEISWPDLVSAKKTEKAEVAHKMANAIATYVNSQGGNLLVPPKQFVTDVLEMDYQEEAIKEELNSERQQMKEDQEELERQRKQNPKPPQGAI